MFQFNGKDSAQESQCSPHLEVIKTSQTSTVLLQQALISYPSKSQVHENYYSGVKAGEKPIPLLSFVS